MPKRHTIAVHATGYNVQHHSLVKKFMHNEVHNRTYESEDDATSQTKCLENKMETEPFTEAPDWELSLSGIPKPWQRWLE